ncbi:MAG: hypothetical protein AB7N71_02690, partial [Phycisphaerae bacterium]
TTELYALVHRLWSDVLAASNLTTSLAPDNFPLPTPRTGPFFCFEKPGRTDVLFNGRKLLGSAQRRIPQRVLQHGSLLLSNRCAAHPGADLGLASDEVAESWCSAFAALLAEKLQLRLQRASWSESQLADVEIRRGRFADANWTMKY